MIRILLALVAALLLVSGLQTWRLSTARDEVAKLRSTVQALEGTLVRNSRATAAHKKALVRAQAESRASTAALERALAASPAVAEWAATPVPKEVQDAP
jgi:hypothetical protein